MTLKNNRAPLLSNIKLYISFHHHVWIQTGVTVQKRLSWVVTSVTLTFDLWPWPFAWTLPWSMVVTPENFVIIRWWEHSQKGVTDGQTDRRTENTIHRAAWSQLKTIGHPFYVASSFVHHFIAIGKLKLKSQSGNAQFGSKSTIFCPVWPWNLMDDLEQGKSEGFDSCDRPSNLKLDSNRQFFHPCDHEIWWITSKNNRVLLLYFVKLCASFEIHWWIQTGFTVQKRSIRVEIGDILSRVTFLEIWWMTLENKRAPLLYYTKLCASFQSHRWSQTWVTVRKRSSRVKIGDFFVPRDLEIWWMTLKNNRASLLYYIGGVRGISSEILLGR